MQDDYETDYDAEPPEDLDAEAEAEHFQADLWKEDETLAGWRAEAPRRTYPADGADREGQGCREPRIPRPAAPDRPRAEARL